MEILALETLLEEGIIEIMPSTFLRGRSIPHAFMLVDEAQNFPDHVIKTITTRIGVGSKVLFNGDPYQIDTPTLDLENNGLLHVTRNLLGEDIFSTVILKKGERSDVADLAARLL